MSFSAKNVDSYVKDITKIQREITRENLKDFKTSYQNDLIEYESKLLDIIPESSHDLFKFYTLILINHISEIRFEDGVDVFLAGFKNAMEFSNYLKDKYKNKDDNV